MSLAVTDSRRRDRSRSRSRDRRSRDHSEDRSELFFESKRTEVGESSYRSKSHRDSSRDADLPYPAEGGIDAILPGNQSLYSYDETLPAYGTASLSRDAPFRSSRDRLAGDSTTNMPHAFPGEGYSRTDGDKSKRSVVYANPRDSQHDVRNKPVHGYGIDPRSRQREPFPEPYGRHEDHRVRTASPSRFHYGQEVRDNVSDHQFKFLPQRYSRGHDDGPFERRDGHFSSDRDTAGTIARHRDTRSKRDRDEDALAYGKLSGPSRAQRPQSPPTYGSYNSGSQANDNLASSSGWQGGTDANRDDRYRDDSDRRRQPDSPRLRDAHKSRDDNRQPSYAGDSLTPAAEIPTGAPGKGDETTFRDRRRNRSPGPSSLAPETGKKDRDRSRDRRSSARDKSPRPPTARMSSLTVDTKGSSNVSLSAAPPSPLLESYKGTYQDCSPMPSPLLISSRSPRDDSRALEALSPLGSDVEDSKKRGRRARFHDPQDIAARLAQALRGDRQPDIQPLIEILPSLTHEQVMELRTEYKAIVKTGPDRKGVNVAKHIRARLKDEDSSLMKACYSVALGKWESEAYWANFWYQGDKTRRELLIESLMGRTNEEIRHIKDSFTDKKYDNSLVKCMKTELKEDKFKKAVLMVLDERRMDDYDPYSRSKVPLPPDLHLVDQDVSDLHKAVKAEKGGESAMIAIVVQRSDAHLRAVLQEYGHHYRTNFAREALKKSGNLVGELLAHILNGVINRPVRDALLLNHALTASRKDGLRRELLISRLIRFHWDPLHLQAVRKAYRERYGIDLSEAVRDGTSGQWGQFCRELCIARMPNDVRHV